MGLFTVFIYVDTSKTTAFVEMLEPIYTGYSENK